MKKRLYLETTIPSYLTAISSRDLIIAAHQQITLDWWKSRKDDFEIYISQFVIDEAEKGDIKAAKKRLQILSKFNLLEITEDVTYLASIILDSGVIPSKAATDAAHISVAAVHNIHFLLTWNCTHIANAEISHDIKLICEKHDFTCPIICTPEELMGEK